MERLAIHKQINAKNGVIDTLIVFEEPNVLNLYKVNMEPGENIKESDTWRMKQFKYKTIGSQTYTLEGDNDKNVRFGAVINLANKIATSNIIVEKRTQEVQIIKREHKPIIRHPERLTTQIYTSLEPELLKGNTQEKKPSQSKIPLACGFAVSVLTCAASIGWIVNVGSDSAAVLGTLAGGLSSFIFGGLLFEKKEPSISL
jgi:hypothetical protein